MKTKMTERDKCIYLWLDAEEENRKDNGDKCMELKDKCRRTYSKLKKNDQIYVKDYLDSIGA